MLWDQLSRWKRLQWPMCYLTGLR